MKRLTKTQFIDKLKAQAEAAGTQRALARSLGCSEQYLSDVLKGRRLPGPGICRRLGYEAELTFIESA